MRFSITPQGTLLAFFTLFVAVWATLPLAVTQTLNRDTIQIIYWGREWQAGYFKHPPLISWVSQALRLLFGPRDIVFTLASLAVLLATFFAVHRLARAFLDPWGAALAVMALTVLGFFSFLAPNLNHNIAVLPFWSLAILAAYRAIEERRPWAWPWLGLWLGLGFMTKYTILLLPPLILAHMAAEPRHRRLLRHPGPWVAALVGLAAAAPHLAWLRTNWAGPLLYFADSAGAINGTRPVDHLWGPLAGLGRMAGMSASLLGLLLLSFGRPRWHRHIKTSADRFLLTMTLGPCLTVLALSAVTGWAMRTEWAMPFFLPLPILLLRQFHPVVEVERVRRFLVILGALSAAMAVTYVLIIGGVVPILDERKWSGFPAKALAERIGQDWRMTCGTPIPALVGDSWLAGSAAYLLAEQPRVYTEANRRMAPWLSDQAIRESGAVIVWNKGFPTQFRSHDHQGEAPGLQNRDWFPGLEELEARFGQIQPLADAVLPYHGLMPEPPAHLGLALVPPARSCGAVTLR